MGVADAGCDGLDTRRVGSRDPKGGTAAIHP